MSALEPSKQLQPTMSSDGSGSRAVIRRRTPTSARRRDGLIKFAKDVQSQNGEDGIIAKIFEMLPRPNRTNYVCVDVGAWDGKHLSNTFALLSESPPSSVSEWKGLLIEADADRFRELQDLHGPLGNSCLNVTVSSDLQSPASLTAILTQHETIVPFDFDFLSIDVDGSDYWLLHDLLHFTNFRPRVVCIEANPTMPNDLIYIPPRDDQVRHGSSVAALVELASQFGYVLVETTVYNCFFVREELYRSHLSSLVSDTSIEALHEVTMGTSLYQLYDGTLKLWGCKKLLWHRIGMKEDEMQMLPPSKRQFPFAPPTEKLPHNVVDLSAFRLADNDQARQATAATLLDQLREDGFALVRGSGISSTLCQEALSTTRAFIHDADESVRRACLTEDRARRGYAPMCTENFASLIGKNGPNDLVRKFRIGASKSETSESPLHRPNVWPSEELWEGAQFFRSTVESYYEETCRFIAVVVEAIVEGLVASQPELREALDVLCHNANNDHSSILTLRGYRKGARHKKTQKKRHIHPLVASHTDVGIITMLLFDGGESSCGRLQRVDKKADSETAPGATDEKWVDVTLPAIVPTDPIWVINVADCLSELSGGELPSTLHRVMPARGEDPRSCLALFMGLNPTSQLKLKDGTVTYEEWRRERIAKAQAVVRSNGQGANGAVST